MLKNMQLDEKKNGNFLIFFANLLQIIKSFLSNISSFFYDFSKKIYYIKTTYGKKLSCIV